MIENEDFKANLFVKNEGRNPTGNFSDRIAFAFFKHLNELKKLKSDKILVDVYKNNLSLSLASKAISLGYKYVIFHDKSASS